MNKTISLEEAQRLVLEAAKPVATEKVLLENARGRVLAEEIRAFRNEPPIPRAAMDGYAVHSADVVSASEEKSVLLSVVGLVGPGQHSDFELKRGEALQIMTGGSVPAGSDAVVPQELTARVSEGIRVMAPVAAGDHFISVGAELHQDEHLISSNTVLGVKELTIVATQGHTTVKVRRQPVVAVLATGSELVELGEGLGRGEVFASNLHTVTSLVNRCGGIARPLGIAGDDLNKLTSGIQHGSNADVVVTTGGTGKGEKDLVSEAVFTLDGDMVFRGVAMSPGKQTLFAKLNETLLFGLPGRPAATFIAFEQLVRPLLLRMLGFSQVFLPEITGVLRQPVKARGKTLSFLFSLLVFGGDGPEVKSLRSETKGILTEMLSANSLLKVGPGKGQLEKGERVPVQVLDVGLEG
ncbi:MAG: molybdopterin molybdotransferase MoeA, partial [Deltaproteobacteria bacterium]|nr:molybdopterin molybdotransferase MoeA [Deltaproteobacteria bacterium]